MPETHLKPLLVQVAGSVAPPPVGVAMAGRKNLAKFLGIDMRAGPGEEEDGLVLDCESVSISSSSTSTGKRASNAAKLLGRLVLVLMVESNARFQSFHL